MSEELDAKTQAWVDEKPPDKAYGGGGDPEAMAEIVASKRQEALREFDDQLALDGVSRERVGGPPPNLVERFGIPPFTILDTRQGYWQTRRRAWLSLGIRGEVGRGEALAFNTAELMTEGLKADQQHGGRKQGLIYGHDAPASDPAFYTKKTAVETKLGRKISTEEFKRDHYNRDEQDFGESASIATGTSVFDPILCEIAYRWFCPEGGRVLDPFAGGSVRGVVAGALGLQYGGIELRPEQVASNREQAEALFPEGAQPIGIPAKKPRWIEGDAAEVSRLVSEPVDLLFTCPPYADLERYSDDPRDLSTMEYEKFREMHSNIIGLALDKLKPDRFAVIVVGEVRDKRTGIYYGFVPDTIRAFEEAGAQFYNDAILVNSAGSAPMRAKKMFNAGRKLVRVHQNFLVFCKGDWKKAAEACRAVE